MEKSCVLFGGVLRDPEIIQNLTARALAPPFPLGRALVPSQSQVSFSLLFSSQKKDNPQHQFSSSAQGSSGKQKMGGTELFGLQNGSKTQTHLHGSIFAVSGAAEMPLRGLVWFLSGSVMKCVARGGVH